MIKDLEKLKKRFFDLYCQNPQLISRAPGRAEVIGNHTDYNFGFALGAAIKQSCFCLISLNTDHSIRLFSDSFDNRPHVLTLSDIFKKNNNHWTNYVIAVVAELVKIKKLYKGFNLLISSDVPHSGGVSSSAALEISVALALTELYGVDIGKLELAQLCQKAENGPLVKSPCGFLDQGTCLLSKKNSLVFFDFQPHQDLPVSKISYVPLNLQKQKVQFVIAVDKNIKRNLGESGYPARRKSCEQSLPVLSNLLNKKINSLREVSTNEFEKIKKILLEKDKTITKRVEHIIYENQRVIDGIKALKQGNIKYFGQLLNQSGKSALFLYDLAENTPELTYLFNAASKIDGVIGIRNMGGGFSANIIALVQNSAIDYYMEKLEKLYRKKYNGKLDFIPFIPSQGAEIIYAN